MVANWSGDIIFNIRAIEGRIVYQQLLSILGDGHLPLQKAFYIANAKISSRGFGWPYPNKTIHKQRIKIVHGAWSKINGVSWWWTMGYFGVLKSKPFIQNYVRCESPMVTGENPQGFAQGSHPRKSPKENRAKPHPPFMIPGHGMSSIHLGAAGGIATVAVVAWRRWGVAIVWDPTCWRSTHLNLVSGLVHPGDFNGIWLWAELLFHKST